MLAESIGEEKDNEAYEVDVDLEKFNPIYEADVEYEGLSSVFVEFCCIVVFDLKLGPTLGCVVPPILDELGKPLAGVSRKVFTTMTSKLPFLALPEGGMAIAENEHKVIQDDKRRVVDMWDGGEYQSMFVLPDATDGGGALFGVSHFVRLLSDDSDRGSKQAAVVVLSAVPLFDVFLHRLHSFSLDMLHRDDCSSQLRRLAHSLKDLPSTLLECSLFKQGLPIRRLASAISPRLLVGIFKLVLLGGRILLFSQSPSRASSAALAVAALFPALGGAYLEPYASGSSGDFTLSQIYRWKKHGFPLKVFGNGIVFQPMLVMVMAESVFAQSGFLAGTTNSMIPTLSSAKLDCMVDLDTWKTVKMNTPKAKAAFEGCIEDRRLSKSLSAAIQLQLDEFNDGSIWLGSNGFVSDAFESYLITLTKSCSSMMTCHPPNTTTITSAACYNNNPSGNAVSKRDLSSFSSLKGAVHKFMSFSVQKMPQLKLEWWQRQATTKSQDEENTTTYYHDWRETIEKKVSVKKRLNQFGQKWVKEWIETECFSIWCSAHMLDADSNSLNVNSASLLQPNEKLNRNSSIANAPTKGSGNRNTQIITYSNGDIYEGELNAKGQAHGRGMYTSMATSHCFDGYWYCGMRHGRGVLTSGSKDYIYEGDWACDARTGQGHAIFKGRESYSGNWLNNQFHGFGEHCTSDGFVYSGSFEKGLRHGAGALIVQGERGCPPCEIYKGEWMHNKKHGLGQSVYVDGSIYTGNWEAGVWHGEGFHKSAHNETYEGEFRNGEKHGVGTLTIPDKYLILEGIWEFGKRCENSNEWHITYVNKGEEYCGQVKDGVPHGEGIFKHSDGSIHSGKFIQGIRCGYGTNVLPSGEVLKGTWHNGSFSWVDGICETVFADGSRKEIGGGRQRFL